MPLKVEQSLPSGGDDVVVFVARSLEEARAAREALSEAGVEVLLPEEVLEALFADGPARVQVRVRARDLTRALDAIDARFPRDSFAGPLAEPQPAEPDDDELPPEPIPPQAAEPAPPAPPVGPAERLTAAATKCAIIALASAFVPVLGLPFSGFALFAALWCANRARALQAPQARGRARLAAGLALGALGWHGAVLLLWRGGHL